MKNLPLKPHINTHFIGAILSIFVVAIMTLFLFNKGLPTAEGWYSYYAKCILDGNIVYSDFEYLFTPVYMYLITSIIKIFGFNLIVLRFFGVIIFSVLTLIIYLILNKIFSTSSAVIGTVTGIYYLQSEVYTVFYDYVRIMDIFAYLATFFMILAILDWQKQNLNTAKIFLWGIFTSLFFLVKQNMGGLFWIYSILLIIFSGLFLSWRAKQTLLVLVKYLSAFLVPIVISMGIFWKANILDQMLNSVFFGAMEAKGGITTILFRWISNNYVSFLQVLLWAVVFVIILILNHKLNIIYPNNNKKDMFVLLLFICSMTVLLLNIYQNQKLGVYFSSMKRLDITILFMVTVILLLFMICISIYQIFFHKSRYYSFLPLIALLGTYFSLCYGAGMSGGLSIGESSLGLAIIICILFDSFRYKYSIIIKGLITSYCVYLCCCCISFKIVYPCNWWGIDDSDIYNATQEIDVPILKDIKVSESTKKMYEGIIEIVQNNTTKADTIFCFPHIPIFYLLCDRNDPGTYTKVQWFDVSTREGIESDIKIIQRELPKAFIVYNLNDGTYNGHEDGFFAGKESATRELRNEIYILVNKYGYNYQGTFLSDSNNISVFTLKNDDTSGIFLKGDGSKNNPYIIETADDLINFAMQVNQGNDFDGKYFRQISNIDLSNNIWVPIGYIENSKFKGHYDFNGYSIDNINCSDKNSDTPFGNEIFIN